MPVHVTADDVGSSVASLSGGHLSTTQCGTGVADSTTYLRGDQSWQVPIAVAPEFMITNPAPVADVSVTAGYNSFADEEVVIANGNEIVLLDGASLTIF